MAITSKTGAVGDRSGVLLCAALGIGVAGVLGLRVRSTLPPAAPTVEARIDPQTTYQTLTGFGASTAYYGEWLASHPQREAIYGALYGELKLDILRLRNTYVAGKTDFASADKENFAGATRALGHAPLVMMSSWSPPGALKSTGEAKNGGTLARRGGSYDYAGFARWWRDSLVAYKAEGIAPDYISIQNEPDWKDTWETCLFRPQETPEFASYSKALAVVAGTVKTLPTAPKLIGPETLGASNPQEFLPPTQAAQVDAVAHHLYNGGKETSPDSFLPALHALRESYPGMPKFQTEFGRGDGFQTAWLIHNCLTEEDASAYLYWAAVWPSADALITLEKPWTPADWKSPQGFVRTDRFYALEHYSRFLKPGYVRIAAQASAPELRLSAFLSPDKKTLVAVALNTAEARTLVLPLTVAGYAIRERYRTEFGRRESFKALASGEADTLPPHALLTWVLQKSRD
jgi:glucuronoarabinoxylan endo-1,4-beta-xylanase